MINLLKNKFTKSLKQFLKANYLQIINHKKNLKLSNSSSYINCEFNNYNMVDTNCELVNLKLGDYSYISRNCTINNTTIGKFCSIGQNCIIGLGIHPTNNFITSHPLFYSSKKNLKIRFSSRNYFEEYKAIEIGNDVWIGARAIIMDGVKIGSGAIIAAGAVVTKDVKPYSIVGGIPAKQIRNRFLPEEIEFILNSKWWDWDQNVLKENLFNFHNIEKFKKIVLKKRD